MYLLDIIIIALCKLLLALLVSPESSEIEQVSMDAEEVALVAEEETPVDGSVASLAEEYVLYDPNDVGQSADHSRHRPEPQPAAAQGCCEPCCAECSELEQLLNAEEDAVLPDSIIPVGSCSPASPLGTLAILPPEIRNKIYWHVLRAPEPISIRRRPQWPRNRPWAKRFFVAGSIERGCRRLPVDRCLSMELLHVSRAVNAEAAGILFRRNRFVFQDRVAMKEFGKEVKRYAGSLWDVPEEVVGGEIVLGF